MTIAMPAPAPAPVEGVTPEGFPITRRGHLALDLSTMEVLQNVGLKGDQVVGTDAFATVASIDARARITGGLFATARFGTGFAVASNSSSAATKPGNLMGGAEYVLPAYRGLWLVFGLSLGAPFVQDYGVTPAYAFADGMWSVHEFMWKTVPLRLGAGLEMVRGRLGLRVDLEPILLFPFDRVVQPGQTVKPGFNDVRLLFRHAVELQYGHALGAGLRYQGVANSFGGFSTFVAEDLYQATVEAFVVANREAGFVRLGFLKTLDEDTAAHYHDAWGFRLSGGFHLD